MKDVSAKALADMEAIKYVDGVTITVSKEADITTIVISGELRSGKTVIANIMADWFGIVGGMSVAWMTTRGDVEQYAGQDVVIFDDFPNALDIVKACQRKRSFITSRFHTNNRFPSVVIVTERR